MAYFFENQRLVFLNHVFARKAGNSATKLNNEQSVEDIAFTNGI
jgi:hypothetical protein